MNVEEALKDAVNDVAGIPRDDVKTNQYGDTLRITRFCVKRGNVRIRGEVEQPSDSYSYPGRIDDVDDQIMDYAEFVDRTLEEEYRGSVMELAEEAARKYGMDPVIQRHDQMMGTTLLKVHAYDGHGQRHGFDYVPNPQQPRTVHKQKLDQLMVSLKDMAT